MEGVGLGMGVGRLELAADLVEGLGDEGGLADELQAEAFDHVVQIALEESIHEGRSAPRHLCSQKKQPQPTGLLAFLIEF